MIMKLVIRSDIIENLKYLLQQDYQYKLRLLFGKMFRTGFVPYLNHWDYKYIKKILKSKYSSSRTRVGNRSYKEIYDIGFVTDRQIILSEIKENEGDEIDIITFHIVENYNVILIQSQRDYQVEIEFIQQTLTLNELFDSIKFLYSLFKNPLTILNEPKSVIEEYNNLFNKKQDKPWIIPQSLRFLEEKQLVELKDYVVMPMYRGNKFILYLSQSGAYLISKYKIFYLNQSIPDSLYNTVVSGDWYEKSFTAYDIICIGNTNVCRKSFIQRMKYLRIVTTQFPFCKMVKYYRIEKNIEDLLNKNEGVIFTPIRANYMNNRTFLYQSVENVGIKFKLEEKIECGFQTFVLKTLSFGSNEDLFTGIKDLPYGPFIPLTKEDKKFIGPLNNTIFEFRWDNDSLVPYTRAYENKISNSKFSKEAWFYINNPIDKKLIINNLTAFKKEPIYVKEISNDKSA